jgi:hypothetical protein
VRPGAPVNRLHRHPADDRHAGRREHTLDDTDCVVRCFTLGKYNLRHTLALCAPKVEPCILLDVLGHVWGSSLG